MKLKAVILGEEILILISCNYPLFRTMLASL